MKTIKLLLLAVLISGIAVLNSCTDKTDVKPSVAATAVVAHSNLKTCNGNHHGKIHIKFAKSTAFDSAGASLDLVNVKSVASPGNPSQLYTIWTTFEHYNLLNMSGGIMVDIGFLPIPQNTSYSEALTHSYDGWAATNGVRYPVTFPGDAMNLIFYPPVVVGEHLSSDVELDIDATPNFHAIGDQHHPSGYIFDPNVTAINNTVNGTLDGAIIDGSTGLPIPDANVWVYVKGSKVSTTTFEGPTPDGFDVGDFVIPGLPEGTYKVYASIIGYTTNSTSQFVLRGNYNTTGIVLMPRVSQ